MEQVSYHIQLPIIKILKKSQIPASLSKILVPHLLHRSIPMNNHCKEMREVLGQHCTSALYINPEYDFGALPSYEHHIIPTPFSFLQDLLSNPYFERPISLLCPPTKPLLPIFRHDHLFPKIVFIISKPLYPFTKQDFVQEDQLP